MIQGKANNTNKPIHLLVFRFSAMGDVALTLPVIKGLIDAYPNVKVTLVTRKHFASFFANIERLEVFTPDFKNRHKGFIGIVNLMKDLNKSGYYDYVIDLHSVIRTYKLCFLYWLRGTKCFVIKKDRIKKRTYLNTHKEPELIHTTERYLNVFKAAGFDFKPASGCIFNYSEESNIQLEKYLNKLNLNHKRFIGIAPFAKHFLKIYPEEKLKQLFALLANLPVEVFLFGGGKTEIVRLNQYALEYSNFHVADIELSLEIVLMHRLSTIVTMDSANMHIATLCGIPVISIWGATHPGMGFGPLYQPAKNTIQIPVADLPCRPCTIYGKGICKRKDFACMNFISPDTIFKRILEYLE